MASDEVREKYLGNSFSLADQGPDRDRRSGQEKDPFLWPGRKITLGALRKDV